MEQDEKEKEPTPNQNTAKGETFSTSTSLPADVWEKKLAENERTAKPEFLQGTFDFSTDSAANEWQKILNDSEKTVIQDSIRQNTFSSDSSVPTEVWEDMLKGKTSSSNEEVVVASKKSESKENSFGRSIWASLLLVAFLFSAVCGLLLTLIHIPSGHIGKKVKTEGVGEGIVASFARANVKQPGVAWIKVYGVIEQAEDSSPFARPSGASAIAKKIREAGEDKNVKAIVLDINSPGGTVASVQNIYSEILKAKENKKVVALFRDVAASGGFYVAMAADQIVAEPGTVTGSIGVIMETGNVEGLFEKIGVKMVPITSGKHKDIGSPYRPMTEEEKTLIQDMVNDSYSQFLAAVKAGRPNVKEEVMTEYTDGRVFSGQRAYDLGFIDKLGGEAEALQLAGELAGIQNPKIISSKKDDLREFIFSFGSSLNEKSVTKQLQSLATPRMSYLWVQ